MRRAPLIFMFAIFPVFLLSGCGVSPLLNHRAETRATPPQTPETHGHAPVQPGCTYFSSALQTCLAVTWKMAPTTESECSVDVHISDVNPVRRSDDILLSAVRLWMPDMGHGGRPPVVQKIDDQTYRISKIYFFMNGRWNIELSLQRANAVDQILIPVKL